jgi:hypothetical protein
VEVVVGGGVFEGGRVRVGTAVDKDRLEVAVTASVGVSVTGALDGRLQADRTRARKINIPRDFIAVLLLCLLLSYAETTKIAIAQVVTKKIPDAVASRISMQVRAWFRLLDFRVRQGRSFHRMKHCLSHLDCEFAVIA